MTSNQAIREMISKKPLMLFSMWSQIQADNLIDIGRDISTRISRILRKKGTVGKGFNKAYGYLSLWIFGAYEMIRTLDQNKNKFNTETQVKINIYKKKISQIRVPLAKQELPGGKGPTTHEPAVMNIDFDKRDFVFKINGQEYEFKELFQEYKELIASITQDSFQGNGEFG